MCWMLSSGLKVHGTVCKFQSSRNALPNVVFFVSHPTEKGPTITDEMDSTFDFVTVQCHLCMIITPLANIIIHHLLFIVSCTPSPITNPLVHTQRDLQMAT